MAATDQILPRLRRTILGIFGVGTINIKDSSGTVQLRNTGDTAFADAGAKQIRIHGVNATNAVVLNAPSGLGASVTYTLPGTDGATGDVLTTNGAGTTSWAASTTNAVQAQQEDFTEATSSPLSIFTPAANAVILEVIVKITAAAAGGSPTVQVGTAGSPGLYMTTAEIDLLTTGTYIVYPEVNVGGTPSATILTITPSAQTFTGTVIVKYANPL